MQRIAIVLAAAGTLLFPFGAAPRAQDVLDAHGPYDVGLRITTYTKPSETTGEPRHLDTHIWYPAVHGTGTTQGNAFRDADVLDGRWPLILFSHGSCGIPDQAPFYMEALASNGFVVAAPSHPGNTTFELATCDSGPEIIDSFANRVADIRFITDTLLAEARGDHNSPFFRRLDPDRIGVTGHSFGGQTTLRVAASDQRIKGAVALAPAVGPQVAGLEIGPPLMVIGAELDSLVPFETTCRQAYSLARGPRYLVELKNTGHCAFAIACAEQLCGNGCQPGTLDPNEAHALASHYAVPFFLQYVAKKGQHVNQLLPRAAAPDSAVVAAVPNPQSSHRSLPTVKH